MGLNLYIYGEVINPVQKLQINHATYEWEKGLTRDMFDKPTVGDSNLLQPPWFCYNGMSPRNAKQYKILYKYFIVEYTIMLHVVMERVGVEYT